MRALGQFNPSQAVKPGDTLNVGGKSLMVEKAYPDGSFDERTEPPAITTRFLEQPLKTLGLDRAERVVRSRGKFIRIFMSTEVNPD